MIVGANAVVLDHRGHVLLILRDDLLTWALPGGALESGELPPDGVAREVEEESGLKVVPQRLTGLYFVPAPGSSFLLFTFLCRPIGGELRNTDEALRAGFHSPQRLPRPFLSMHREHLLHALAHSGGPPYWGRQRPSLWLGFAHWTISRLIYGWLGLRRRRKGLPPYQPPLPWNYGAFTIIRDDAGNVLWIKRTDHDVWNLPGGGPLIGESPWDTAIRETREETGLAVRLTNLSGVYVKPAEHSLIFTFTAEAVSGRLTTGPEAAAFSYFAVGDEPANTLPKQLKRAADASNDLPETVFRIQAGPSALKQF